MWEVIFPFIGGLGLFLVGMMLLSDGLVGFAGGALRRALVRFTGTPAKAFASGALLTALVQSSTATTVTLIGFVSAGLITFSQAIGVVIGASLGNTATGWIVAGLGLKVNLGFYTLPLIGIGALLKLLTRGRGASLGLAIAGLGMLFLGLNTLQDGMRGLSDMFSLAGLPSAGLWSHFLIMLIGLAMTTVLQSSTAAIATTLTALHTGAINLDQAAAVVVGASIGTTLTGALVTIGATVYAKRTALAHILFNLAAGLIAIVLLPVFLRVIAWLNEAVGMTPGAVSLAAFHSLFIGVGVLLILPQTPRFARLVERLLPQRGQAMAQHLDASLLTVPTVAIEASQRALEQIAGSMFARYDGLLDPSAEAPEPVGPGQVRQALEHAYEFVTRIPVSSDDADLVAQRIAQLHAIDHLLRLNGRLQEYGQFDKELADPRFDWAVTLSREMLASARQGMSGSCDADSLEALEEKATSLAGLSRKARYDLLRETGSDSNMRHALHTTDALRWFERTGNHVWRICHYLASCRTEMPAAIDEGAVTAEIGTLQRPA